MQTIVIALIKNAAGEILSLKRTKGTLDGIIWSLHGGKLGPNENERDAVAREVLEETGIICIAQQKIGGRILADKALTYWQCSLVGGSVREPADGETTEVAFRTIFHL